MKIEITRASVSMADDCDAPHKVEIEIQEQSSVSDVVMAIYKARYLPSIQGHATWSVDSNNIIAVIAQKWNEPKLVSTVLSLRDLNVVNGVVVVHINYHVQQDPNLVYEVLKCLDLRRG